MHACHIYNRTPMQCLNWCTPYEKLYGEQPRIDHLQIFGCGAWVHLSPEVRKDKLSPKAELMTYVGIAPGGHGYLFMHETNAEFTGAHAIFDESMFPQCGHKRPNHTRQPEAPLNTDPLPPMGLDDGIDDLYDIPQPPPTQPSSNGTDRDRDVGPMPPAPTGPSTAPQPPEE